MTPIETGHPNEVIYAKDQPEYIPLPAIRYEDGMIVTKWKLTWRERVKCLMYGRIFLSILTFNRPLQPVKLSVDMEE